MKKNRMVLVLWGGVVAIILSATIPIVAVYFLAGGIQSVISLLIPISGFVALISICITSWLAVYNYRLKLETEKRLDEASILESNIRILTIFSKMMQIANARYDPIISEQTVENLCKNGIITPEDCKNEEKLKLLKEKLNMAIFQPSYGQATQEAATGAVFSLGKEYPILLDAAIGGLDSLKTDAPDDRVRVAIEKYLAELKSLQCGEK